MSTTGATCLYAEIGNSGTGGAAYRTSEEAMMAAASLNGSSLGGWVVGAMQDMFDGRMRKVPICGKYILFEIYTIDDTLTAHTYGGFLK